MSNLSHWNPFNALLRAHPNVDVEAYLRGFGPRVIWADVEAGKPSICLDISEDDEAYHVTADIPGAAKQDIELSVEGNTISISAEIKSKSKRKESEKELCSERRIGKVSRCFAVASEVDDTKANAVYEDGVLTVTLPKKSQGRARGISIG